MSDPIDNVIEMVEEQRRARADSERLSTDKLDVARQLSESMVTIYAALSALLGLSDGVRRMIAADARHLAAAESDFQAAVEAREAVDVVLDELRSGRP